jgi:elongation factor Ts
MVLLSQKKLQNKLVKSAKKIDITDYALLSAETVVAYNHSNGKVGVLVAMNKKGEAVETVGKRCYHANCCNVTNSYR